MHYVCKLGSLQIALIFRYMVSLGVGHIKGAIEDYVDGRTMSSWRIFYGFAPCRWVQHMSLIQTDILMKKSDIFCSKWTMLSKWHPQLQFWQIKPIHMLKSHTRLKNNILWISAHSCMNETVNFAPVSLTNISQFHSKWDSSLWIIVQNSQLCLSFSLIRAKVANEYKFKWIQKLYLIGAMQ